MQRTGSADAFGRRQAGSPLLQLFLAHQASTKPQDGRQKGAAPALDAAASLGPPSRSANTRQPSFGLARSQLRKSPSRPDRSKRSVSRSWLRGYVECGNSSHAPYGRGSDTVERSTGDKRAPPFASLDSARPDHVRTGLRSPLDEQARSYRRGNGRTTWPQTRLLVVTVIVRLLHLASPRSFPFASLLPRTSRTLTPHVLSPDAAAHVHSRSHRRARPSLIGSILQSSSSSASLNANANAKAQPIANGVHTPFPSSSSSSGHSRMRDILHITSSSSSKSLSKLRGGGSPSQPIPTMPSREPLKETTSAPTPTGTGAFADPSTPKAADLAIKLSPRRRVSPSSTPGAAAGVEQNLQRKEFKSFDAGLEDEDDAVGELVIAQKVVTKVVSGTVTSRKILMPDELARRAAEEALRENAAGRGLAEPVNLARVGPRRPDRSTARPASTRQRSEGSTTSPPSPVSDLSRSGSPTHSRNPTLSSLGRNTKLPPMPASPASTNTNGTRAPVAGPSRPRTNTSTSYLSLRDPSSANLHALSKSKHSSREQLLKSDRKDRQTYKPRLPAADVPTSPAACLYWSQSPVQGHRLLPAMRAHSASLVGDSIWVFGGCGPTQSDVYSEVWRLDTESFWWQRVRCEGEAPPACRSHSATVVGTLIFIFAGGDQESYINDLYVLDTGEREFVAVRRGSVADGEAQ